VKIHRAVGAFHRGVVRVRVEQRFYSRVRRANGRDPPGDGGYLPDAVPVTRSSTSSRIPSAMIPGCLRIISDDLIFARPPARRARPRPVP
jgi:hypothetical protein